MLIRKKVDETVKNAIGAGCSIYMEPQDHGWTHGHSFADLGGHQWKIMYLDENAIPL